jgi:hypothetical protein
VAGVGPGQTPMSPQQQSGLAAALSNVSPPPNPKTPFERTDPQHLWLIALQRVRQTLRECNDQIDDKDDTTQAIVTSMGVATERLLAGVPPQEIALMAAGSMIKGFSPQLATQLEQAWVQINRPPSVPGMPVPTGPLPQGGMPMGAAGPQAPTPPMNGAPVMGGPPGIGGSPPPGLG